MNPKSEHLLLVHKKTNCLLCTIRSMSFQKGRVKYTSSISTISIV